MRLIYSFLALWQLRLARLDLARSDMLQDDADAALDRSRARLIQADAFAVRAGLPLLATIRR